MMARLYYSERQLLERYPDDPALRAVLDRLLRLREAAEARDEDELWEAADPLDPKFLAGLKKRVDEGPPESPSDD